MKTNFSEHVSNTYKDSIAHINGKEYIDMEVFNSAVSEYIIYDAIIGCLFNRLGNISVSEEEVIDYITGNSKDFAVKYDKGMYTVRELEK